MPTSARKSIQLKVSVTPELHERLREVAAQLGQAPATAASMAIGQWVAQMTNTLGAGARAVDGLVGHVGPELARQMRLGESK
jgi:predicted transcriptional regulator